jgi:transcriptional regulator with XRE-family HTH domain
MVMSPEVARVEFATRIRARRRELGKSAEAVCQALEVSRVYYSAIENHRDKLSRKKLPALVEALRFDEATGIELTELLEEAHQPERWSEYGDLLDDEFRTFLEVESGALSASIHESRVVTGLLQTEEYASEVIRASPLVSTRDAPRRLEIRMRRQQRLRDKQPLRLKLIMGESTLLQHYGPRSVLVDQLSHLVDLITQGSEWLDLRVQPFERTPLGLGSVSTAVLLEFASPHMPRAVYRESINALGLTYEDQLATETAVYFERAQQSSLDRDESLRRVQHHLAKLQQNPSP